MPISSLPSAGGHREAIQASTVGCSLRMPKPETGTLDIEQVSRLGRWDGERFAPRVVECVELTHEPREIAREEGGEFRAGGGHLAR